MSYFAWDPDLDVGVEAMNDQHKELIAMMEGVYQKNISATDKKDILQSVAALMDFVAKHFHDEEMYMASIGFPGLKVHKKIHQNLLTDLNRLIDNYTSNDDEIHLSEEFMAFLNLWIITHIMAVDTKYGED